MVSNQNWRFRYDVVVVEKDKERATQLQQNHGGWDPRMAAVSTAFFYLRVTAPLRFVSVYFVGWCISLLGQFE